MTGKGDFSDKLRLKEMAEEDIYFARRERELIEALHAKKEAVQESEENAAEHGQAQATGEQPSDGSVPPRLRSQRPAGRLRRLLDAIFKRSGERR